MPTIAGKELISIKNEVGNVLWEYTENNKHSRGK